MTVLSHSEDSVGLVPNFWDRARFRQLEPLFSRDISRSVETGSKSSSRSTCLGLFFVPQRSHRFLFWERWSVAVHTLHLDEELVLRMRACCPAQHGGGGLSAEAEGKRCPPPSSPAFVWPPTSQRVWLPVVQWLSYGRIHLRKSPACGKQVFSHMTGVSFQAL